MRDYDPNNVIEAMQPELAKVAEKTSNVLLVPTLADILHEHEQEFVAVGIGTPGKRVWAYTHRRFESCPLRHRSRPNPLDPNPREFSAIRVLTNSKVCSTVYQD